MDDGWSRIAPPEVASHLEDGKMFYQETSRANEITGWFVDGQWLAHKSDEDLAEERRALLESFDRRNAEQLEKNRSDWQAREDQLPEWIKSRLTTFHETGGEYFELNGWGYELIVCELAALYRISNGEDTETIESYARLHGTTGNQHDCAKLLARIKNGDAGFDAAHTVSALTPITGEPFYEVKA